MRKHYFFLALAVLSPALSVLLGITVFSSLDPSFTYSQLFNASIDVVSVDTSLFTYVLSTFTCSITAEPVGTNLLTYYMHSFNAYINSVNAVGTNSFTHKQGFNYRVRVYENSSGSWVLVYESPTPTPTTTSTSTTTTTQLPSGGGGGFYTGGGGAPVITEASTTHNVMSTPEPRQPIQMISEVTERVKTIISSSPKQLTSLAFVALLIVGLLILFSGGSRKGRRR